jgi:hypothetical protein
MTMEPDANAGPREKKIRWALIIIVLFIVCLAIDHFFLHILFQEKLKVLKEENRQSKVLPKEAAPASQKPQAALPQKPQPIDTAVVHFQENIKACLGVELAKNTSPESLIQNYLEKNPVQDAQFQLENTHVRLPDGSTRRLHLIHSDSTNSKHAREFRYFQLDAEGLPVRIPLKKEESFNPRPEFLESLKKQGSVVFHQVKENKILKDGTNLSVNTVNDKVFEFQVFSKNKTLSCRELDCLCR